MKPAALGVRMHSGWGALVAVSNDAGIVEVIERRRIAVVSPGTPGVLQPYHFAKNLELAEAKKFLANCSASSTRLAESSLRKVMEELHGRQYRLVGAAVLLASGRPLPALANILASHPLIHTAEGIFFRQALSTACETLSLSVTGVPERDLDESVRKAFGRAAPRIQKQISTLGRSLGPPWTTDQKTAALSALLVLASKPN
jgi:hypothetical protein